MMINKRGFSLLEILIAVMVVGLVAGFAIQRMSGTVKQSESIEAYVYSGTIKQGQEMHKLMTGDYVALESTEEINEVLNLGLEPKYYDFRVILPEKDKFLIIAQRIGEDIESILSQEDVPDAPTLIVMSEQGIMNSGYQPYITSEGIGNAGANSGSSGGSSSGGSGGSSFGGGGISGGTSGGGGGGGSSGGSSSGSSGGGTETSNQGNGETGTGGSSTTGGGVIIVPVPPPQTIGSNIAAMFALLNGTAAGQYYYDLINRKEISVIFDDFSNNPAVSGALAFWQGPVINTIFVSIDLLGTIPDSAIAAIITHEAVHADYSYNPEKVITETLTRHTELSRTDLSIVRDATGKETLFSIYDPETDSVIQQVFINNSIDEEYSSFANEAELWQEIKGTDIDINQDAGLSFYLQGEATLKSVLRILYSDQNLPELKVFMRGM